MSLPTKWTGMKTHSWRPTKVPHIRPRNSERNGVLQAAEPSKGPASVWSLREVLEAFDSHYAFARVLCMYVQKALKPKSLNPKPVNPKSINPETLKP